MIHGGEKLLGLYGPWRDWCEWCLEALSSMGFSPRVVSGKRSSREQMHLYQAWVGGRSRLPAAPPGRSAHEYGLAIDVWDDYGNQGAMMRQLAEWGGELVANDPPHVQYPGFRRWLSS